MEKQQNNNCRGHIKHIGDMSHQFCDKFASAILSIAREDIDKGAIADRRLFEAILPQELGNEYPNALAGELLKYGFTIDTTGDASLILCQNVPCHRDKITGSHQSIVAGIGRQTGRLLIHDKKDGKIVESAVFSKGAIFSFDHHDLWHSVRYAGDVGGFLVLARASVFKII